MAGELNELKDAQVSHGLNLWIELKAPANMGALLGAIAANQTSIDLALTELHYVHFARFLPARGGKALLVITEFDGGLESYVMDFALAIGDVFDLILKQAEAAPPLPVRDHPAEFLAYVKLNNTVVVATKTEPLLSPDFPVFSAYSDKTVLDIKPRRLNLPPKLTETETPGAAPALDDIQGNILRGYNAQFAKHFALRVVDRAKAGKFLADFVGGKEGVSQVTTAVGWRGKKPSFTMNVGFTFEGLKKLGLAKTDLEPFSTAFKDGPANAARCRANGDVDAATGEANSGGWVLGQFARPVHVLLSVYAFNKKTLRDKERQLTSLWHGALELVSAHETEALEAKGLPRRVHFGYQDGISQPRFAKLADPKQYRDILPDANVGDFLLGAEFINQFGGKGSLAGLPAALAQNATFAAVRLLEQDVSAFDAFLERTSAAWNVSPEWVAARIMGRWRNGAPLSLSPDSETLAHPAADLNMFDYAPSKKNPAVFDDNEGLRCPVGAHMRRMNPRSALVAGKAHSRRIIRRGMPYTVTRNPLEPKIVERGLFGLFICADLERQFEFMMAAWVNGDLSASGIQNTQDPIMGAQRTTTGRRMTGQFKCVDPRTGRELVTTVPRLVNTRGSLYLFMPGIKGIQHVAALAQAGTSARVAAPAAAPIDFDPTDGDFIRNPYPTYTSLRATPSVRSDDVSKSLWVFSHAGVQEVCTAPDVFLKTKPQGSYKGDLMLADGDRHDEMRKMLGPDLEAAIVQISQTADRRAEQLLAKVIADRRRSGNNVFDFVAEFAHAFASESFMQVMGISDAADKTMLNKFARNFFDRHKETIDANSKGDHVSLDTLFIPPASKFAPEVAREAGTKCPASQISLLCGMKERCDATVDAKGDATHLNLGEVVANLLVFTLAGYRPVQGLIASGTYLLLRDGKKALNILASNATLLGPTIDEVLRYNPPVQMAQRYASKDTMVCAAPVAQGDLVTVVYASANRDETVCGTANGQLPADVFDIQRMATEGFGFGFGGRDCIGEELARIVAGAAFKALVTHGADLELVKTGTSNTDADMADLEWLNDPQFHFLEYLPLRVIQA